MVDVNIKQLALGLLANSDQGHELSSAEVDRAFPGHEGDLDAAAIDDLRNALCTQEADGSYISATELQQLRDNRFFRNERGLFSTLNYYTKHYGFHKLFSPHARETMTTPTANNERSFHLYIMLNDAGFTTNLDEAHDMLGTTIDRNRLEHKLDIATDQNFARFVKRIADALKVDRKAGSLQRDARVRTFRTTQHTDARSGLFHAASYQRVETNSYPHTEMTIDALAYAYQQYGHIIDTPQFIAFAHDITKHNPGINVLEDIDHYITLFKPMRTYAAADREAIRAFAPDAQRIQKHFHFRGTLRKVWLEQFSGVTDKELIAMRLLWDQLVAFYAIPSDQQATLTDLIILRDLIQDDRGGHPELTSPKIAHYLNVVFGITPFIQSRAPALKPPRTLTDIVLFTHVTEALPENGQSLHRIMLLIETYGGIIDLMPAREALAQVSKPYAKSYGRVQSQLPDAAELTDDLQRIDERRSDIRELLQQFRRFHPNKPLQLRLKDLSAFAAIAALPNKTFWMKNLHYLAQEAPFNTLPFQALRILSEHPEQEAAARDLIKNYTQYLPRHALHHGLLKEAVLLRDTLTDNAIIAASETLGPLLHIETIRSQTKQAGGLQANYRTVLDPQFQKGVQTILSRLSHGATATQIRIMQQAPALEYFLTLYDTFPAYFHALTAVPQEVLGAYAVLFVPQEQHTTTVGSTQNDLPLDPPLFRIAALQKQHPELLSRVQEAINAFGWSWDYETVHSVTQYALNNPQAFLTATRPDILTWYQQGVAQQSLGQCPTHATLPRIQPSSVQRSGASDISIFIAHAPQLYAIRKTIQRIESLGVTWDSWGSLKKLLDSQVLLKAFREDRFVTQAQQLLAHFYPNKRSMPQLMKIAHLYFRGITVAMLQQLQALDIDVSNADDHKMYAAISAMSASLQDPAFGPFYRNASTFAGLEPTLDNVYGYLQIFTSGEPDALLATLRSSHFATYFHACRQRFLLSSSITAQDLFHTLASYRFGIPFEQIDALFPHTGMPAHQNHIYILAYIASRADLRDLLKDRAALVQHVEAQLQRYPSIVNRTDGSYGRERPSTLDKYPSLMLVCAILAFEHLEQQSTIDGIVTAAHADIADHSTEHGGALIHDHNSGRMALSFQQSISLDDGCYSRIQHTRIQHALLSFHFHTVHGLERAPFDWRRYAGPSDGDMTSTRRSRLPGMTITGVGIAGGRPQLNFDLYMFVPSPNPDDNRLRFPKLAKWLTLDLGVRQGSIHQE